jgi:hypothetical protein
MHWSENVDTYVSTVPTHVQLGRGAVASRVRGTRGVFRPSPTVSTKQCVNPAVIFHIPAFGSHQPRYGNEYFGVALEQLFSALSMSSSEAFGQYSRQPSQFRQAVSLASRAKSCRQRPRLSHQCNGSEDDASTQVQRG